MCRNIRPLYNFEPATTGDEVRNAALQFVRKVSGMNKPSKANEEAFTRAIDEISHSLEHMLGSLVSNTAPRNRDVEAAKGRARSDARFEKIARTYGKVQT